MRIPCWILRRGGVFSSNTTNINLQFLVNNRRNRDKRKGNQNDVAAEITNRKTISWLSQKL